MANKEHLAILEKGVDVWNQWREENPDIKPDISGAKLRNRKLRHANFSHADMRGTDFKESDLTEADFQHARGGLRNVSVSLIYLVSIIAGSISGFFNMLAGIFLFAIVSDALKIKDSKIQLIIIITFLTLFLLTSVIAIKRKKFFSIMTFWAWALAWALALALALALAVAVAVAWAGAWAWAVAVAGAFIILSGYIAWRSIKEDEQFGFLRMYGLNIGSKFGTNFEKATLYKSNFSESNLKACRFKDAVLIQTIWHNSINLQFTLFSNTILENRTVRELLIQKSPNCENQNLSELDLRGAYLANGNFKKAQFQHSSLSQVDFTNSNLTGANLHGTSRDGWITTNMTCEYVYWDEAGKEKGPLKQEYTPDEFEEAIKQFQEGSPDLITRFIEFPEEYHQAGVSILNYFSEVIRKKYPESNATVRIEQDGLKIRMVIDPVDGEREVIEETLQEFGMVVTGKMEPEEFSDDKLLVIELKNELRIAKVRIDMQRDLLDDKGSQIDKLLSLVGAAVQKETPQPQITVIQDKNDKNTTHHTSAQTIQSLVQSEIIENLNHNREENMGDSITINAKGDVAFGKDQAIVTINKTISNADIPETLENKLKQLTATVEQISNNKTVPEDQSKNVTSNLERFVTEAAKSEPEKQWCQITGKGLIEAAQTVGSIAKPVIDTTQVILKMLGF